MSSVSQIDTTYEYKPLKSKSHIRLLRIKTLPDKVNFLSDGRNETSKASKSVIEDGRDGENSIFCESSQEKETINELDAQVNKLKRRKTEDGLEAQKKAKLDARPTFITKRNNDAWNTSPKSSKDLAFDIVQISLEETDIPYDTVSYVWGSPARDCYTTVDDHPFPITSSLGKALTQLAGASLTGLLWIDQLCINQDDIEERNQQVSIMGCIYEQSQQCLVPFSLDGTFGTGMRNLLRVDNARTELTLQDFENIDEETCYHMINWIYRHEWFQRVWVFQEVILARSPLLLIERWKLSFDILGGLNRLVKSRLGRETAKATLHGYIFVDVVSRLREQYLLHIPARGITIDELLNELANNKASEPRDHIYAFMAVAIRQYNRFDIKVDYSLSVPRTFAMATRAIIPLEGLSFFAFIPALCRRGANDQLPSWCPDWQTRVTAVTFPSDEPRAARADWSRNRAVINPSSRWYELILSGAVVDTVKDVFIGSTMKDLSMEIGRTQGIQLNARTMHNNRNKQHERFNLDNLTRDRLRRALDEVRTICVHNNGKGDREDAARVLRTWRFLFCDRGGFGFATEVTKVGDKIAVFHGARRPVVLRMKKKGGRGKSAEESRYTLIGECYYDWNMQGEDGETNELNFEELILE